MFCVKDSTYLHALYVCRPIGIHISCLSHAQVSILDVRGHVDTVLVEEGAEKSTYLADYDAYLEGHIPVSDEQQHL
jgi:hypothetical protein